MGRIYNIGISQCGKESVQCLGTSKFETLVKIQEVILLAWILNTHVYAIALLYFGGSNYDVLGMLGEPMCNTGIQNDSLDTVTPGICRLNHLVGFILCHVVFTGQNERQH